MDENRLIDDIVALKSQKYEVSEAEKMMISEYCTLLSTCKSLSRQMKADIFELDEEEMKAEVGKYEKLMKIVLSLYKTLGIGNIEKDDMKDNPFLALTKEALDDDDF